MEHIQKYYNFYLAKRRMVLNDSDFEMEFSSLLMKQKQQFQYEDIKPCFGTGSMGGFGWGSVGWVAFFFGSVFYAISAVVSAVVEVKAIKFAGLLVFLVSILAALVFSLIRFIKHKCVYIYDKNDDMIAYITITETSKDFIEEFQKRVELANEKNRT